MCNSALDFQERMVEEYPSFAKVTRNNVRKCNCILRFIKKGLYKLVMGICVRRRKRDGNEAGLGVRRVCEKKK